MVTCDIYSSKMTSPFVVYNGTKLKDMKNKTTALAWKLRNWHDLSNIPTDHMAFQNKHWFDDDITIEYFELLLGVLYPGKKFGLSLDMAPAN